MSLSKDRLNNRLRMIAVAFVASLTLGTLTAFSQGSARLAECRAPSAGRAFVCEAPTYFNAMSEVPLRGSSPPWLSRAIDIRYRRVVLMKGLVCLIAKRREYGAS